MYTRRGGELMDIISHLTGFFNEEKIQSYIHELRWKGKELECPHCGSEDIGSWGQYHRKPGLKRYICKSCGKTFNDITGTIFHYSHLPLSGWLLAAFLMALGCSLSRIVRKTGSRFRNVYRIGWHLRNLPQAGRHSRSGWDIPDMRYEGTGGRWWEEGIGARTQEQR
jgi:transposase-like protein